MKKIFLIFFSLILFISCTDDDDNFHYELLPITKADVPAEFDFGKTYTLSVKYIRPDECYVYSDILYEYDLDTRDVAVISTVKEKKDCETIDEEASITFMVKALQTSPYIFKFWQGDDDNGNPIYLIIEVPVNINNNKRINESKNTHTKV